jgi:hypothetical protein
MITNPEYKGPWKRKVCFVGWFISSWPSISMNNYVLTCFYSQKIKNPNYKGKWKIPWIDNPGEKHGCDLLLVLCSLYSHIDNYMYCSKQ